MFILRLHEKCTIKIKGKSRENIASVNGKILCLELQRGQVSLEKAENNNCRKRK